MLEVDRFIEIRRGSWRSRLVSFGVFRCNSVGWVLMRLDFASGWCFVRRFRCECLFGVAIREVGGLGSISPLGGVLLRFSGSGRWGIRWWFGVRVKTLRLG